VSEGRTACFTFPTSHENIRGGCKYVSQS
jgi:hypothetical protein